MSGNNWLKFGLELERERRVNNVCHFGQPHGRQAGRAVGCDWWKWDRGYQTDADGSNGHLRWPGRLVYGSSRGRSLELRLHRAAGPQRPATSTSSPLLVCSPFAKEAARNLPRTWGRCRWAGSCGSSQAGMLMCVLMDRP